MCPGTGARGFFRGKTARAASASLVLFALRMNTRTSSSFPLRELSVEQVRDRAARACTALRSARAQIGRVGGLFAVDEALDRVERLLPGVMDRHRRALDPVAAEARDRVMAELMALLQMFEQAYCGPVLAAT